MDQLREETGLSPSCIMLSNRRKHLLLSTCLIVIMLLTCTIEVTTIILNSSSSLNQTLNTKVTCRHTEEFTLSTKNKMTVCIQERKINIEIDRFQSNSICQQRMWLNEKDWRKLLSVSEEHLLL